MERKHNDVFQVDMHHIWKKNVILKAKLIAIWLKMDYLDNNATYRWKHPLESFGNGSGWVCEDIYAPHLMPPRQSSPL